ncbi:MAG: T9SS type A sorting domain-containing protein [Bacteroidales bacterium]|jgi:hypothetical protein|nr:T9SS type A sorting domain-containing protein [Bacteroidales bacterium]
MKIKILRAVICIAFNSVLLTSFAQTQSMQLPIPSENAAVINFTDPANPVLVNLPATQFNVGQNGPIGNPHIETNLRDAYPPINEFYLGQHPMFCQSVVNDADGNLLFFIVDNNIYNRFGEAFKDENDDPVYMIGGAFTVNSPLFDNVVNGEIIQNYRYSIQEENIEQEAVLDPEICIFPLQNECYQYGLVCSAYAYGEQSKKAQEIIYRTITYVNDSTIILSDMTPLLNNNYINEYSDECFMGSTRDIAVTDYREEYDNYLLFLNYYGGLYVIEISGSGIMDLNNIVKVPSNVDITGDLAYWNFTIGSEMELIETISGGEKIYKVAYGLKNSHAGYNNPFIIINEFSYNEPIQRLSAVRFDVPSFDNSDINNLIKGLEFSADGNILYYTYTGQTGLYTYPDGVNLLSYLSTPPSYYQYSEIELGRDGNMYFLYSDVNENGGVARLTNPNSPNCYNFTENVFPSISKIYTSYDHLNDEYIHKGSILLFADQIDGSDYTSYYNSLSQECCRAHIYYGEWPSATKFDQNTDWTWEPGFDNNPFTSYDGKVMIENNVRVPSGKKLTLKNFELRFNQNAKLVLEPGATLILENSTLGAIDKCGLNQTWPGVEVQGNFLQSQLTPGAQAKIILNNSTIENAVCGIVTRATDNSGNIFPGSAGGIILAKNSNFINCQRAVKITAYRNFNPSTNQTIGNLSYFKNCTFELNNNLHSSLTPEDFVLMARVQNIRFFGCDFIDSRTNYGITRPDGIVAFDSKILVKGYCNSLQINPNPCPDFRPTTFTNLNYGIKASNALSLTNNVVVDNCVFTHNWRDIYLRNADNSVITNNKHNINFTIQPFEHQAYGLYLEECTGYKVQNNEYYSEFPYSTGCFVTNSGTSNNIIDKNYFHNLATGIQAEGENGSKGVIDRSFITTAVTLPAYTGLQFKCNTFEANNIDIAVASGTIKRSQGYCSSSTETPAGNQFINSGSIVNIHAYSTPSQPVTPFHYSYHNSTAPNTIPATTNMLSSSVTFHACSQTTFDYSTACPATANLTIADLQVSIVEGKSALMNSLSLIDGGNTQALLDNVNSGISGGQLKDMLVSASPYLSDTVLMATLERADALSPGNLKEVLIPNSPLTEKVMTKVTDLNLPRGIMLQINNAQSGVSARAIVDAQIESALDSIDLYEKELLNIYLNDTTGAGLSSLINFYSTLSDVESKKMVVQAAVADNNISVSQAYLSQVPQISQEDIAFVDFYSLVNDLALDNRTILDIDSTEKILLEQIAQTNTVVSSNAQVILDFLESVNHQELIQPLNFPDASYLNGAIVDNYLCGNNRIEGDTLVLVNTSGEVVKAVTPVVSDANGSFRFDALEMYMLNKTDSFAIKTVSGFALAKTEFKTIPEWLSNTSNELTLAPVNKQWADAYTHPDSVYNTATALDLSENLYVTGYCMTNSGVTEAHLVRYAPDGTRLWSGAYSYSNYNVPADVTTDASGNVYVVVNSTRTSSIRDIIVVKYDNLGNRLWESVFPGTGLDEAIKIKATPDSEIVVVANAQNRVRLIKIKNNGNESWSNYYNSCVATNLDVDNNGCIYISARTSDSQVNQGMNLLVYKPDGQLSFARETSRFASAITNSGFSRDINNNTILSGYSSTQSLCSKIDFAGNVVWEKLIPNEKVLSVTTDSAGNVYRGSFISGTYSFTKCNGAASDLWTTTVKFPTGTELGTNLKLDLGADNSLFFGSTMRNYRARNDYFVGMIDPNSNLVWEQQYSLNSNSTDDFADIQVSNFNNVYLTGSSRFESVDSQGHNSKESMFVTVKFATCPLTADLRSMISSGSDENVVSETDYLRVFPNPSDGNVFVEYNLSNSQTGTFTVYTATGSPVLTVNLKTGLNTIAIDEKMLSEGVYYYQTIIGTDVFSGGKLLIIR